jgi:hypothetical protein
MIKELITLANELDSRGLSKESDLVDKMIKSAFLFKNDEMDDVAEGERQKRHRRWKAHQVKMRQVMAGKLKEAFRWFSENLFVSLPDDTKKFPLTVEKDLTVGLSELGSFLGGKDTQEVIIPAGTTVKSVDQDFKPRGGRRNTISLRDAYGYLKKDIQANSVGDYAFALPEDKKEASYLDSLINKDASFIPKKIEPFRVTITGGRFEGGLGMAVDRYDDGVFGIDLDEPMYDSARGFAMEDQIERIDATDSFKGDASSSLEKEVSAGPSLTWVNRGDWEDAKASLRKHKVFSDPDAEGLDRMEKRDLDAMQSALDQDLGSEAGYLVINPWDAADFRMFVQDQMDHPEGKEIAVPLSTFEVEGKRISFFKINDWKNPSGNPRVGDTAGDRFGKVEEDV